MLHLMLRCVYQISLQLQNNCKNIFFISKILLINATNLFDCRVKFLFVTFIFCHMFNLSTCSIISLERENQSHSLAWKQKKGNVLCIDTRHTIQIRDIPPFSFKFQDYIGYCLKVSIQIVSGLEVNMSKFNPREILAEKILHILYIQFNTYIHIYT